MHSLVTEYIEGGWHLRDHRQALASLALKKKVLTDHDYITIAEKSDVPYYRDLLYPHGLGGLIAITVETPNGIWILTIQCAKDHPGLSKEEAKTANKISALITKATFAAEKYSQNKFNDFVSLLGESSNDIIILDPEGKILKRYDGMGIYCDNPESNVGMYFYNLINPIHKDELLAVCSCPATENRKMDFHHKINGEELSSNVIKIPASIRHYYSRAKVIVYTSKIIQKPDTIEQYLNEKYDLTHSEVIAAKFLAEGYSLSEISEVLGLEETTIRQRFKVIYSKTGMKSQAKLVTMMFKVANGSWTF